MAFTRARGPDGGAVLEPPVKQVERGKYDSRNEILSEFRYGSEVEERGTRFLARDVANPADFGTPAIRTFEVARQSPERGSNDPLLVG
jgi:hypothetical protein